MWGKSTYFLLFIFIILIIIPLLMIKAPFRGKEETGQLIKVYNHLEDRVVVMGLDEYLRGVVAAEMPALYNMEALKAQAVAARTYTLKLIDRGQGQFAGASLSTDSTTCQAWLSEEAMKERWGFLPYFYYWARINRAVEETAGQVLYYHGSLIDAVYHANSGGWTENAAAVWGSSVPYLVSVESKYDREQEKNYYHIYYFSLNEIMEKLALKGQNGTGVQGAEPPSGPGIEIIEKNESGRVKYLKVAGRIVSGTTFRQKLSLPSTRFNLTAEGGVISLEVYGKGHGVGMSQDGANGMARHGYDYRAILQHYYPGTTLTTR